MEIKQAISDGDFEKCNKYLESKGLFKTNTLNLFYVEDKDGNVIGCMGCEYIMCIEPFASDFPLVGADLYKKAIEDLTTGKATVNPYRCEAFVTYRNRFLQLERLYKKLGFEYISRVFRFVKQINPKDHVH